MHAVALLTQESERPLSCHEMAEQLHVSEAHLSKVLQRLGKQGFVTSLRGPKGGFRLACDADEISLLNVYEAIEGPLQFSNCLFEQPVCNNSKCIMGDLLRSVDQQVAGYLKATKLSDMEIEPPGSNGRD
jgi:Rrf2 family iron-sulfur cluster assembly transcriptional regulator